MDRSRNCKAIRDNLKMFTFNSDLDETWTTDGNKSLKRNGKNQNTLGNN